MSEPKPEAPEAAVDTETEIVALRARVAELEQREALFERTEKTLRESEERFRQLADNAFDLIVELDEQNRMVYINKRTYEVLGYAKGVGRGSTPDGIVHPEDKAPLLHRWFTDKRAARAGLEARYRHADGSWRWLEFTAGRYITAGGEARIVAIGRDVTQRRESEDALRRTSLELEERVQERTQKLEQANRQLRDVQGRLISAERLGAAEEFAGSVAHAINNPLTALIGRIEMALNDPGRRSDLHAVLRLAHRIRDVVDRTLHLWRKGTLNLVSVTPAELLADVRLELEERARRQGVKLLVSSSECGAIVADRTLVVAALGSLAENGLDAMPDGGTLWLGASPLPAGDTVRFRVADDGPGIPIEVRPRVFDPFFTTKPHGTGLGLPIVQGIVRGHKGRVSLANGASGGTVVLVDLPTRPD
jgi:PAS domain S-box-containing protein